MLTNTYICAVNEDEMKVITLWMLSNRTAFFSVKIINY